MSSEGATQSGVTLDHVMIMVRDLRQASDAFGKLGFRVRPGGRHPGGTENTIVPFGIDMPYLELVGIYQPGGEEIRDNEEFLAKGEGAMYVGLRVQSVAEVIRRLRDIGINVRDPTSGTIVVEGLGEKPPPLWLDVVIPHGSSPRVDPLFFVESHQSFRAILGAKDPELLRKFDEERRLPHPNESVNLAAAWIAVGDLDDATQKYRGFGFRRIRELSIDRLQARAVEFALDRGSLLVMESMTVDGPIRKLLDLHDFGIEVPGVSIEVHDVERALRSMTPEVAAQLQRSAGPWGRNVVIPAALANGVWIELFEREARAS